MTFSSVKEEPSRSSGESARVEGRVASLVFECDLRALMVKFKTSADKIARQNFGLCALQQIALASIIALALEQPRFGGPLSMSRNEKRDSSSFDTRQRDADELREP